MLDIKNKQIRRNILIDIENFIFGYELAPDRKDLVLGILERYRNGDSYLSDYSYFSFIDDLKKSPKYIQYIRDKKIGDILNV